MALITIVIHDQPDGSADVRMNAEPLPREGVDATTPAEKLALAALKAIDAEISANNRPRLLVVEGDGTVKQH